MQIKPLINFRIKKSIIKVGNKITTNIRSDLNHCYSQRNCRTDRGQPTYMMDDFHKRKVCYSQSFFIRQNHLMRLQLSMTDRFYYLTMQDVYNDCLYKIRFILSTGQYIRKYFQSNKNEIKNYIYKQKIDNFLKMKWFLSMPFSTMNRKYYFNPVQGKLKKQIEQQQYDLILRQKINKIDRTEDLFGEKNILFI